MANNNVINLSNKASLYSGDFITLRCDDGSYWKSDSNQQKIVLVDSDKVDETCSFVVEVVEENKKIHLRDSKGYYLKRLYTDNSYISLTKTPDAFSQFSVLVDEGNDENKMILQADNGEYYQRFYTDSSVLVTQQQQDIDLTKTKIKNSLTEIEEMLRTVKLLVGRDGEKIVDKIIEKKPGEEQLSYIKSCKDILKNKLSQKTWESVGTMIDVVIMLEEELKDLNKKLQTLLESSPCSFLIDRGGTKCKEIVKDINFDETNMLKSIDPFLVGEQTLVNNTSQEQTQEFTVSKTISTTKTFNWDYRFSIGVETTFKVGIPLIAENETTVKVETGFSVGGSKSDSETQTFEATFPVKVGKRSAVKAKAVVQLGKLDVPYTATIARILTDNVGNETKYTYEVKGIFKGTNAFNLINKLEEQQLEAQIQIPPKGQ